MLPVGAGVGCARRARLLCSARGLGACARPVLASLVLGRRGAGACVRLVLAPLCFGGWGLGAFVRLVHSWDAVSGGGSGGPAPVFCAGVGCAWFPDSCSRCSSVVFAEGFPGVFVSARRFLPLVWGVSGWVGVCFSGCCARPGLGSGSGLVLFGEFDPGSGRTLAACLTHASRTGPPLFLGRVEWRTGEYHVSNLPSSPG